MQGPTIELSYQGWRSEVRLLVTICGGDPLNELLKGVLAAGRCQNDISLTNGNLDLFHERLGDTHRQAFPLSLDLGSHRHLRLDKENIRPGSWRKQDGGHVGPPLRVLAELLLVRL